jgi:hypothetical protein
MDLDYDRPWTKFVESYGEAYVDVPPTSRSVLGCSEICLSQVRPIPLREGLNKCPHKYREPSNSSFGKFDLAISSTITVFALYCAFEANCTSLTMAGAGPKTLNFITGNKNKLAEVKAILGDVVELQSKSLDLVEIQGTSEEIALDKCRRAAIAVSTHGQKGCFQESCFIGGDSIDSVLTNFGYTRSTDQSSRKTRLLNSTP